MSRRTGTLVVTGVLLVALLSVAWLLPVPYVAMSPGPTADVLGTVDDEPVVEVEDGPRTYQTPGELDLTTVAVTRPDQRLDLLTALSNWVSTEVAVVPRDYLYPEDQTPDEIRARNVMQMETSQHEAIAAALRSLDFDVPEVVMVYQIVPDSPAEDTLELGDVLVAVDGTEVEDTQQAIELVGDREPGDEVELELRRDGETVTETVQTVADDEDPGRAIVGFYPNPGYDFPFEVTINVDENIGGPSAGLMFALAIVDKLTEDQLIAGRHVAGTGTIDGDGNVGQIGGVQQKVAAAAANEASVFLTPAGNCESAMAAGVDEIMLAEVATLADAVTALEALADGRPDDVETCGGG